jgi:hypothetical protein
MNSRPDSIAGVQLQGGKLFFRLLEQAVQVGPVTYDAIIGKETKLRHPEFQFR